MGSRQATIPRFSGVLSTAGGVVFSGQLTGEFEAFDADNGKKLWQFQTGSGIEGQPVTWQQDGVQYVAVAAAMAASIRCSPATSGWRKCRPADHCGCSR